MAASWNPDILDRYVAPDISKFTKAVIPTLEQEGEKVEHWMANHFLSSVFRGAFVAPFRQFAFNMIYRAQTCFEAYEDAAKLTVQFIQESTPGSPKSRLYYRALRAWEACFINLQTFVDLINRSTGEQIFERNDGTPQQRAYAIANAIKHWGQFIARGEHDDGDTVPMWLTDTGFRTRANELTFDELAELLRDAARVVEDLRDPRTFARTGDQ